MTRKPRKRTHQGVISTDRYVGRVLATIRARGLAGPADPILVAVSGGPDSTALLAALAALSDLGEVGRLTALHVDHGLRVGAEAEAAEVGRTCARLGVPFRTVRVCVAPGNVQAEARRARYAALREEAERVGAVRIATGHTRTDQAETVLLRLARGAGARGLSGIPPRRGPVVRPLIDCTRSDGIAFLRTRGIGWSEDPSNATPRFARNRLRQRLWPALLEQNPAAEAALARTADLLREDERTLARLARRLAEAAGGPGAGVPAEALHEAPAAVRRRVVRRLARDAAGRDPRLAAAHVERVLALLARRGPGRVQLPGGLVARVEGGRLRVAPGAEPGPAPRVAPVVVAGPGRYAVPPLDLEVLVELAAASPPSPWPLLLRTRSAGDTFRPAGGRGGKKLKAWLIDRKVARARRDRLLLLADEGGRVLAIPELGVVADGLPQGVTVRLVPRR